MRKNTPFTVEVRRSKIRPLKSFLSVNGTEDNSIKNTLSSRFLAKSNYAINNMNNNPENSIVLKNAEDLFSSDVKNKPRILEVVVNHDSVDNELDSVEIKKRKYTKKSDYFFNKELRIRNKDKISNSVSISDYSEFDSPVISSHDYIEEISDSNKNIFVENSDIIHSENPASSDEVLVDSNDDIMKLFISLHEKKEIDKSSNLDCRHSSSFSFVRPSKKKALENSNSKLGRWREKKFKR